MNPCVFDLIWGTGANWGLCVPRLGKSFLGARGGSCLSGSFECGHLASGPCLPLCPPLAPLPLCSIMGSRTKRASRRCLRGKEVEREIDHVQQQGGGMGRRDRERGQGQKGRERKRRVGLRHRWIADWLTGEIFGRCRPLTPRLFSPLRSGSALHVREQGSTSCYLCHPGGLQEGEGLSGSAFPILPMDICPQALVSKPCTAPNR